MVRNRTPSEVEENVGPLERSTREEAFFRMQPWNSLPYDRRGTQALKKYLAKLLCSRIEETFPTFIKDIQSQRIATAADLDALGPSRSTLEQKRALLTKVAHDFHDIARQSLRGRYDHIATNNMKLRMIVREANDVFAREMLKNGHSKAFIEQDENIDKRTLNNDGRDTTVRPSCPTTTNLPFVARQSLWEEDKVVPQSIFFHELYRNYSFEEARLSDYTQSQDSSLFSQHHTNGINSQQAAQAATTPLFGRVIDSKEHPTKPIPSFGSSSLFPTATQAASQPIIFSQRSSDIYQWIRDEIKTSRGTELQGTLNPDILPILFHRQVQKWLGLSQRHFQGVTESSSTAIYHLLATVCMDSSMHAKITTRINQINEHHGKECGLHKLSRRMSDILSGHLQTNNPAFEQKVNHARKLRFQSALERYRISRVQSAAIPTPSTNGQSNGFGAHASTGGSFAPSSAPKATNVNTSGFGSASTTPTNASPANENQLVIDMRDTEALFAELHFSSGQNLENEVHDTLKAYYEIARDDFIEFVNQLVVEPYLNDPKGPVLFFSPVYVASLKDEEIEELAAEDEETVRKRARLEQTLARLSQAEKIAGEYS